jgi:hypothetical protein
MTCRAWPAFTGEFPIYASGLLCDTYIRHRDGQKRPVYIYRFLTAGTIDGKLDPATIAGVDVETYQKKSSKGR